MERLLTLIVDEGKWAAAATALAVLSVAFFLHRDRHAIASRSRVATAMNLFFGVTIGTMAAGHLLAVTTKFALGTLRGHLLALYIIGVALAVPAWLLIRQSREAGSEDGARKAIRLNAWLAVTLVVLGIHNLPLVVPAVFNVIYLRQPRLAVARAVVTLAVIVNLSLFIGSLVFAASGQSFEQFSGMPE